MKTLLILFLLSFSLISHAASLKELLQLKTSNYLELKKFYGNLKSLTSQGEQFCSFASSQRSVLEQIFYDDRALIRELSNISNHDYRDYAAQLEENSYTPLFSLGSYESLCDVRNYEDIKKLDGSLQYHLINIDYLLQLHEFFSASVN